MPDRKIELPSDKATLVVTLIVIIAGLMIYVLGSTILSGDSSSNSGKFDSQKWKDNKKYYREDCIYDLMSSQLLDGKSQQEIKNLLGESDPPAENDRWGYDVPPRTASFSTFVIYFKNGKVKSYEIRSNP